MTPKPQANTLEEMSVTMILDDGNETEVIEVDKVKALITEARIDEVNIAANYNYWKDQRGGVRKDGFVSYKKDRLAQLKENKS